MAEAKGHKSPKRKKEGNKAQWACLVGSASKQAHRPKKRQKWSKPNKPMSSSIKDEHGQKGRMSRVR